MQIQMPEVWLTISDAALAQLLAKVGVPCTVVPDVGVCLLDGDGQPARFCGAPAKVQPSSKSSTSHVALMFGGHVFGGKLSALESYMLEGSSSWDRAAEHFAEWYRLNREAGGFLAEKPKAPPVDVMPDETLAAKLLAVGVKLSRSAVGLVLCNDAGSVYTVNGCMAHVVSSNQGGQATLRVESLKNADTCFTGPTWDDAIQRLATWFRHQQLQLKGTDVRD